MRSVAASSAIAFLTTNLARGGAETQVARLALGLARRGWSTSVISLVEPTAFTAELAAAGIPVFSLGLEPGRPHPRAVLRLASALRTLRPRILHGHMFHANLCVRMARLFFPVPLVVSTIHSVADAGRRSGDTRRRDLIYRLTGGLSDATTAVCRAAALRYRATVVPNGVDTRAFRSDEARRASVRAELGIGGRFAWLAAGRLMWKKDYATMLEAFARLPGSLLLIAGEGPERAALQALAERLRVDARFLGLREDIAGLMNAADGFVSSSVVEGLPMVLIEAAASGLPAVATGVGGVEEAVLDDRTGYVVPPRDPARLAEALARMMETPARLEMVRAARRHAVARFDIERVLDQWEDLYRGLLA